MSKSQKISYSKVVIAGIAVGVVIALILIGSAQIGITGNAIRGIDSYNVLADNDAVLGNAKAPVTIVAFYDLNDPYTRRFHNEVFPLIKKNYIDTNQVKFIVRDFPLDDDSLLAAQATECTRKLYGDQAYWTYQNLIFEKQNFIDSGLPKGTVTRTIPLNSANLVAWAEEQNYAIKDCLTYQNTIVEVQSDHTQGIKFGIDSTPSFIINNQIIKGAQPYEEFQKAIESALSS